MAKGSGIRAALAVYGARLTNHNWAVSARIDGAVVLSLWQHLFRKGPRYTDDLSRWSGLGNAQFRRDLQFAYDNDLPIRLVVAISPNPDGIDRGESGSNPDNSFTARPEFVGRIVSLVGDDFTIEFAKT